VPATIKIEINSQASGSGFRDAQEGLNQIDQSAQKASGGISGIGAMAAGALGGIVVSAAASAASAIGSVVSSTVGLAGKFEGGMNEFAAAAGGSLDQAGLSVGQFQDLFLQLGSELPVSTTEVQQAAIALVKGGLDPAVLAAGGLRDNLLFASAAGMGLEEAANLSVKMLGTFTNVTDDAATKTAFMAESQNLLVKAANASTLDVASLGDAMLQAGGQAKTMGLSYEDFVTSMGLISPAFGSASEAGTSFKNFLVRLQPTTGPAKDAMEALGLYTKETGSAFFDAEGKFVGVEKASELLKQTTEGLSDEQRVLAFQTIFGNDAMGAAAALAAGGATAYQLFAEQMANANGITEQSAAVQQGLDFAMDSLQGTIESLQIEIGLKFLPVLTVLVEITNNVVQALMGSQDAFNALPAPIQAIVSGIFALGQMFQNLLAFIQPAIDAIAQFGSGALSEIITFVTTGKAQFDNFNAIWSVVTGLANTALQNLISYLQTNLPIWIATLLQWGTALWQWVQNAVPLILQQLGLWLGQLVAWYAANLPTFVATLLTWATAYVQWISDSIPTAIVKLGEWIGFVIRWLNDTGLPAFQEWGKKAAEAFIAWVASDLIPKVGPALGNFVTTIIEFIGRSLASIASAALDIGGAIISGIAKGIGDNAKQIVDEAIAAATSALDAVKKMLGMKSPSRVFANEVGLPMAQGMAVGLAKGAPLVAATAGQTAAAGLGGAQRVTNTANTRNIVYNATFNNVGSMSVSDAIARSLAGV
jgi:TP901 family phage tail tape measure protein